MTNNEQFFHFRAYGTVLVSQKRYFLPIFDEVVVKKTERKKIQILVSGAYKKGVWNNEKSPFYRVIQDFFTKNGFSFGVEVLLTKNISQPFGIGEEKAIKEGIEKALELFLQKSALQTKIYIFPQDKDVLPSVEGIDIVYFPHISLPQNFITASLGYQNISCTGKNIEKFVRGCFYEIDQKFLELEAQKNAGTISAFGFIGFGPSIFVIKN